MDTQPAHSNRRAIRGPKVPPTRYVLMLRLCQDKVSPLDGVTPSCCPRPLLQLATQCCARDPEERPSIEAVLEQLQGKVLRSIDAAASRASARGGRSQHSRGGATPLRGRMPRCTEPADDEGGGALGPAAAHAVSSDHNRRGYCSAESPSMGRSASTHAADDAHRAGNGKQAVRV